MESMYDIGERERERREVGYIEGKKGARVRRMKGTW